MDGQLQVTRDDAHLLVVMGRIARQLQDLGRQVLQHRCQVNQCAGPNMLDVIALAEKVVDSARRELQAGSLRTRFGLSTCLPRPDITVRILICYNGNKYR